jgi:hypothetical protein
VFIRKSDVLITLVCKILSYKRSAESLGSNKRKEIEFGIQTLQYLLYKPNVRGFGRSSGSNRNSEQSHVSSLWQDKVRMARMKEVLAFPSCFFFKVVAPLYLEELDYFTPHDTILLIQDLDWVLGV